MNKTTLFTYFGRGNMECVSKNSMSNVYTQEVLINLLGKKGIINKEEVIEEIKRLRREQPKITK
jgi:hypothetical protein